MKAADLIQILMRDENIDKDMLVVQRRPATTERGWRPLELQVEDVIDYGANLQIVVDLPEAESCATEHCADHDNCMCDCDLCRHCLEM